MPPKQRRPGATDEATGAGSELSLAAGSNPLDSNLQLNMQRRAEEKRGPAGSRADAAPIVADHAPRLADSDAGTWDEISPIRLPAKPQNDRDRRHRIEVNIPKKYALICFVGRTTRERFQRASLEVVHAFVGKT
jgi:hypothetical protein